MRRFINLNVLLFVLASCGSSNNDLVTTNEISWLKVPTGEFSFGDDNGMENEKPAVPIHVEGFFISKTEVTNAMFEAFVEATHYLTDAEKNGGGMVFIKEWIFLEHANWKHPMGPNTSIDTLSDHPVVHVSQRDAKAYCNWAGGRFPTEMEWEYACKLKSSKNQKMNIWSGQFPENNDMKDGFLYTAPVTISNTSDDEINHMKGNVWEWCEDNYHFEIHDKLLLLSNPNSNSYSGVVFDPIKPAAENLKVIKGGSFMCHKSYCAGYRPEARQNAPDNEGYFHIGFRIVKSKLQ